LPDAAGQETPPAAFKGNIPVVGVGIKTVDVMGTKLSVTEMVPVGVPLPAGTRVPTVIGKVAAVKLAAVGVM